MNKMFLILIITAIILFAGCASQNSEGSTVKTKEITIEKTLYVCWDNSSVSSSSLCPPQPEKIIERTVEVKVNITKYVCSDGNIVENTSQCVTAKEVNQTQTFSGNTADVTKEFYLKPGLVLITGSYKGERNFIVHLLDSKGSTVDLVFNEIGDYNGKHATQIKNEGYYRLAIEGIVGLDGTEGTWTLEVDQ